MKVRPGVEVAGLTDIGCQRENNEDNYIYWESDDDAAFSRQGRLVVVADGMGGAEGGQHASQIAVETVRDVYSASQAGSPQQGLADAFREANDRVQQCAMENPRLRGMGTTLTACAIVGNTLYYAHVGDSRLLLLRAGQVRQLTRDHSLVARLIESGTIRAEDAEKHPQRNVLTAAIGVMEEVRPDTPLEPVKLEHGDILLLCTDGLWGQVNASEMGEVLAGKNLENGTKALINLAKQRGGPDNITAQIVRIG